VLKVLQKKLPKLRRPRKLKQALNKAYTINGKEWSKATLFIFTEITAKNGYSNPYFIY
jgi:YesN/AraC family two-component response regulator